MKILLTGVTGYIGKRLLPFLLKNGHEVVCIVRDTRRFNDNFAHNEKVHLVKADLLDESTLINIPKDIDIAYYFVHSMGSSNSDFSDLEAKAANNFVTAINTTKVSQVIYLSGIINKKENLSEHLKSRLNVEKILQNANANFTILRAAIIIGSGSASFEIIRDLGEKLPIMITPKWLKTKCQPIAIKNVIEYLLGVIDKKEAFNKIFDIGGPDILTYKEMLLEYAKVRNLRRLIITVPVLTPRLSSYWLYFVTSTNFSLARSLVNSMKNEVVCNIFGIENIVDTKLIGYSEAIERAFKVIDSNQVPSSWIDATNSATLQNDLIDKIEVPKFGCLVDERKIKLNNNFESTLQNIWEIGGENGWYFWNWAWSLRGFVDKIFGGAIPKNYVPSVEKGVVGAMAEGVIAGYPLTDIRVTVFDGSYHEVDSSDMAFKIAAAMALRKGVTSAKPCVIEPIMNVEVAVPEEYLGSIMGDLNSRRGRVLGMDKVGKKNLVKAQVPAGEISNYAIDLRSITRGYGKFSVSFSHYEELPQNIAQTLIEKHQKSGQE